MRFARLVLRLIFPLAVAFAVPLGARAADDTWREIKSPHFTVISNGKEKEAQDLAQEFEKIRVVYSASLPGQTDPAVPVVVYALKRDRDFRDLFPGFSASTAGFFRNDGARMTNENTKKETAPSLPPSLAGLFFGGLASLWIGSSVARHGLEGKWLPFPAAVALAILATIPFLAFAVVFHGVVRRDLDEMLQRVLLEGLAFALIAMIPLATLWVTLASLGVPLPRLDPPDVVIFPGAMVTIGVLAALRRYA